MTFCLSCSAAIRCAGVLHPSRPAFLVILEAALVSKCRTTGKEVHCQCKSVTFWTECRASHRKAHWVMTKRRSWKAGYERCLHTHPELAPALASNQPCENLWTCLFDLALNPVYDDYPTAFRGGLCFTITAVRYLGVFCACLISMPFATCPLILHCEELWLLSSLKITYLIEDCSVPFPD